MSQQIGTFGADKWKRRLLTPENLTELGINPTLIQGILESNLEPQMRYVYDENNKQVFDSKGQPIKIFPDGVSINETNFGIYEEPSAAQRGWMAYMEIGAPLVEERSNVVQPIADVLSTRSYENRSSNATQFNDTVTFTIGNTITWTLGGDAGLTFTGTVGGSLEGTLSEAIGESIAIQQELDLKVGNAKTVSTEHICHAHKDELGTEDHFGVSDTLSAESTDINSITETCSDTTSVSGTAGGNGSLATALALGINGSLSGTITTSYASESSVSGDVPPNTRTETMASQRRQIKQYTYEIPITFGGFVALHYPQLVQPFGGSDANNPQPSNIPPTQVVAREINHLNFVDQNKQYRPKGMAETVSTLNVDHVVFENKSISEASNQNLGTSRPHNL